MSKNFEKLTEQKSYVCLNMIWKKNNKIYQILRLVRMAGRKSFDFKRKSNFNIKHRNVCNFLKFSTSSSSFLGSMYSHEIKWTFVQEYFFTLKDLILCHFIFIEYNLKTELVFQKSEKKWQDNFINFNS